MEELFKGLGINPAVLFSQIVAFLILFWILSKFLFKRIGQVIKQREDEVMDTYQKIKQDKEEADQLAKEYRQRLDQIEKEAMERLNRAFEEGKKFADEKKREAIEEKAKLIEDGEKILKIEREKMLVELKQHIIMLSIAIAEKLIEKNIDTPTNRKLAEKFFEELEKIKTV